MNQFWYSYLFKNFYLLILQRKEGSEKEKEKHWFVVPLIYAFIGWFLNVPWLGIKPTTLMYQDDTVTSLAILPGLL